MNVFRSVVFIILIKPVIKNIMPKSDISKYIDFVLGIMIITLLIMPVFNKIPETITGFNIEQKDYSKIYKQGFEKRVEQELNNRFDVNDVDVTLDENNNIIDVSSAEQKKIKEYLGI